MAAVPPDLSHYLENSTLLDNFFTYTFNNLLNSLDKLLEFNSSKYLSESIQNKVKCHPQFETSFPLTEKR